MYLFVYGTLQPGFGNYRILANSALWGTPGTVSGSVYWVSRYGGGYPVAKFDEPGTIKGTLLCIKGSKPEDDPGMYNAHRMELGAGYEAIEIEVAIPDGHPETGQKTVTALAYHYKHKPQGKKITSGDWAAEERVSELRYQLKGTLGRLQNLSDLLPVGEAIREDVEFLKGRLEAYADTLPQEPEEEPEDDFFEDETEEDYSDQLVN